MPAAVKKISSNDCIADAARRILAARSIHRPIANSDDLREAGMTSLDMVNLVLAVESAFDLEIPESMITPANFRSVASIDALITSLTN